MIIFVLCIVIGLFFLIGAFIDGEWGQLIVTGICAIIFFLCAYHVSKIPNDTIWKDEWKTNIIALKDNSSISGSIHGGIFVTSGYIKEEMYYYCMESTNQGKHMIKVDADNSYIIETDETQPSIIKQKEYYTDKRLDFWVTSLDTYKYIIYVPKGTVDTTYKVNLE